MHETFDVGDTLQFEGPRNAFYLGTAEHEVLFVIGGIGVTPILPMIQVAAQRGIDWRAIYTGRSREYMPLLDEVVAMGPDQVTVWADDERGRFATVSELLAGGGTGDRRLRVRAERHAGGRPDRPQRTCRCAIALRAVQPGARGGRGSVRIGARAISAGARGTGESDRARRHARWRPHHPLLVPARVLRHVQGESACRTGGSPWPRRVRMTTACWCASRGPTVSESSSTPETVAQVGHLDAGHRLPVHRAAVEAKAVLLVEASRDAIGLRAPQHDVAARVGVQGPSRARRRRRRAAGLPARCRAHRVRVARGRPDPARRASCRGVARRPRRSTSAIRGDRGLGDRAARPRSSAT